ncbi:MAG: HAD family hydrolase [Nocardioides sp.]|nr:HAD family hydrolase [Nocardioides sp.]
MDGTLLDADHEIPDGLWPLLERMGRAGIAFAPASGRQYAMLARMFERAAAGMVFIAENGCVVVRDDVEISSTPLDPATVRTAVTAVRSVAGDEVDRVDVGAVVCGRRTAYVERTDATFRAAVDTYYASVTEVDDLLTVDDEVVKVAVWTSADPTERVEPALAPLRAHQQVVVSGQRWVDVMPADAHKGHAVRALQESLGVTPEETVAFGDYLNDLEMLDAAGQSYAMANAHPQVLARARHRAPSNADQGVLVVLRRLLDDAGVPA